MAPGRQLVSPKARDPKSRSRLRSLVKKLYSVPLLGYWVRVGAAIARLPDLEAYHSQLLRDLDERLRAIEGTVAVLSSRRDEQAELLAEAARLLEELRAAQASAKIETDRKIARLRETLDRVESEALDSTTTARAKGSAQPGTDDRRSVTSKDGAEER